MCKITKKVDAVILKDERQNKKTNKKTNIMISNNILSLLF